MSEPLLRVLFFCGERSPWGRAHLAALLDHEDVELAAVVIPTEARWETFRRAVTGRELEKRSLRHRLVDATFRAMRWVRGERRPASPWVELEERLRHRGIPVASCDDANDPRTLAECRSHGPGVVLSAAYPQIFGSEFLAQLGPGAYNSHPSLLPRCRGAHPVFWAIASGERLSGGTIHVLTPELDAGDVVARVAVEIAPSDGYRDLYMKLEAVVPELVRRFVRAVRQGVTPVPQDDAEATTFRNDRMIHHRLFWSERSAEELERLVRAAAGSAFFWDRGTRIRVLQARHAATNRNLTNDVRVPAGAVVDLEAGRPVVAARTGFLVLEDIAAPLGRSPRFEIGQVLS